MCRLLVFGMLDKEEYMIFSMGPNILDSNEDT